MIETVECWILVNRRQIEVDPTGLFVDEGMAHDFISERCLHHGIELAANVGERFPVQFLLSYDVSLATGFCELLLGEVVRLRDTGADSEKQPDEQPENCYQV